MARWMKQTLALKTKTPYPTFKVLKSDFEFNTLVIYLEKNVGNNIDKSNINVNKI